MRERFPSAVWLKCFISTVATLGNAGYLCCFAIWVNIGLILLQIVADHYLLLLT